MSDEREERRPRRRRLRRVVVDARTPIGDAEEIHPVLVHVVLPLYPIEDGLQVLDLARLPPEGSSPRGREHRDLLRPERAIEPLPPRIAFLPRLGPADTAVKVERDPIPVFGIVVLGNEEDVLLAEPVLSLPALLDEAGLHVLRVPGSGLEARIEIVEIGSEAEDVFRGLLARRGIPGAPQAGEGPIEKSPLGERPARDRKANDEDRRANASSPAFRGFAARCPWVPFHSNRAPSPTPSPPPRPAGQDRGSARPRPAPAPP